MQKGENWVKNWRRQEMLSRPSKKMWLLQFLWQEMSLVGSQKGLWSVSWNLRQNVKYQQGVALMLFDQSAGTCLALNLMNILSRQKRQIWGLQIKVIGWLNSILQKKWQTNSMIYTLTAHLRTPRNSRFSGNPWGQKGAISWLWPCCPQKCTNSTWPHCQQVVRISTVIIFTWWLGTSAEEHAEIYGRHNDWSCKHNESVW